MLASLPAERVDAARLAAAWAVAVCALGTSAGSAAAVLFLTDQVSKFVTIVLLDQCGHLAAADDVHDLWCDKLILLAWHDGTIVKFKFKCSRKATVWLLVRSLP